MRKALQDQMKTNEIRQAFIKFFESKGHQSIKSSPLIPANDQTLLFTNAGMVQFKDIFLGKEDQGFTKAVSAQRCLRAGGTVSYTHLTLPTKA